jgi:hypothetical protein
VVLPMFDPYGVVFPGSDLRSSGFAIRKHIIKEFVIPIIPFYAFYSVRLLRGRGSEDLLGFTNV